MSSELELLKQRITEFKAENAELRKENTMIPDFKIKLSVFDAEVAELKRKSVETLRVNYKYNERRDVKIKKLEQKNAELENRLVIVKKNSVIVDG